MIMFCSKNDPKPQKSKKITKSSKFKKKNNNDERLVRRTDKNLRE